MVPDPSGEDSRTGIVALQPLPDGRMRVYRRDAGILRSADVPFYPFLYLTDPAYVRGISSRHWVKELEGDRHFRFLIAFTRWSDLWDAVRLVMDRYNKSALKRVESYAEVPIMYLRHDAQSQFLLQTGHSLFEGMAFDDLHRLQLDIETYTRQGFHYSNPERPDDRIILIAMTDNRGWSHVLTGRRMNEREMLEDLVRIVQERDPDVVEGHNILNYDLPYLLRRFELHGISPRLGRDEGLVRSGESLPAFGERGTEFQFHEIPGRHIIDTYMLLQAFDAGRRNLDSYGLKSAAKHFGFAKTDRVYVRGDKISWYWDHEPDILERYALDDAEETRALSDILSPAHFHATRFIPAPFGSLPRLSSSARVESMMVREYLKRKHSLPAPAPEKAFEGGVADIHVTGILGPVIHIGIESLYASILVRDGIAPSSDDIGAFASLISDLFATLHDEAQPDQPEALQSAMRMLLGSFVSSLSSSRCVFNDPDAAERVVVEGDSLYRSFAASIRTMGGIVIESGADGMFIVPSPDIRSEQAEKQFVASAATMFTSGVRVSIAGRYKKMLAYKKRNYALLTYDERVKIRGSSLASRSYERYLRHYLADCIDALLNNRIASLHDLYANLARDILDQHLVIDDVVKTETFHDTLEQYDLEVGEGKRRKQAAYELARHHAIPVRPGERISYYITGSDENVRGHEHSRLASEWDPNFSDINASYYLKRLNEVSEKFSIFFTPKDFAAVFSMEGLFAFSPEGIRIQTVELESPSKEHEDEPDGAKIPPLRIWLDSAG